MIQPFQRAQRNFYIKRLARMVVTWNTFRGEMSEAALSGLAYCVSLTIKDCEEVGAAGQAREITKVMELGR